MAIAYHTHTFSIPTADAADLLAGTEGGKVITPDVLGPVTAAGQALISATTPNVSAAVATPTGALASATLADRFARDRIWVEDHRLGSDSAASADHSAIMRALDLAETTGRPVKLHPQVYTVNAYIDFPNNVAMEGFGAGYGSESYKRSEIKAAAGSVSSTIILDATSSFNVALRGFRINGNAENNVPSVSDHANLRCLYGGGATRNFYAFDVWFYNARSHGISISSGAYGDLGTTNYFERCIASYNGSKLQIDSGGLGGTGFNAEGLFFKCLSEYNYLAGWKTSSGHIDHCVGRYNNEFFEDGLGEPNTPYLKITNNIVYKNSYGIYVKGGADDVLIAGNSCTENGNSGIQVRNTARRIVIRDNFCRNNGTGTKQDLARSYETPYSPGSITRDDTEAGLDGITLLQTSGVPQDIIISGNHCYDDRSGGSKTQEYGFYTVANATRIVLSDNDFAAGTDNAHKTGAMRISTSAVGIEVTRSNVGIDSKVINTTSVTVTGPQGSAQDLIVQTIPARGLHQGAILRAIHHLTVAGTTDTKTIRDLNGTAMLAISSGTTGEYTVDQTMRFKSSSGGYEIETKIYDDAGTLTTAFSRDTESLTAAISFKLLVSVPGSGDSVQQTRLELWQER